MSQIAFGLESHGLVVFGVNWFVGFGPRGCTEMNDLVVSVLMRDLVSERNLSVNIPEALDKSQHLI